MTSPGVPARLRDDRKLMVAYLRKMQSQPHNAMFIIAKCVIYVI